MIGGTVIEVIEQDGRLWVNCSDGKGGQCAVWVAGAILNLGRIIPLIAVGDSIWWQGDKVFWTPHPTNGLAVGKDIVRKKIGYSGAARPTINPEEKAFAA